MAKWSDNNRDVWYTTKKGKVARDSVVGLARADYFYFATPLSDRQVAIVKATIDAGTGPARDLHKHLLANWLRIQQCMKLMPRTGDYAEAASKGMHAIQSNFVELIHTKHELEVRPILERLSDGDIGAISEKQDLVILLSYIGHVSMRTKWMRDAMMEALAETMQPQDAEDFKAAWWFLSLIYGTNLGQSLIHSSEESTLAILATDLSAPFIFSDNPALNIHPDVELSPQQIHGFDYFMPLSPTKAIVLCESGLYQQGLHYVSNDVVHALNLRLAEHSDCIIGNEREVVERYRTVVGTFPLPVSVRQRNPTGTPSD